MGVVEILQTAWGWTGLKPAAVVGENDFGNLMIKDTVGRFWRLCPEELSCEVVASDLTALSLLSIDPDFVEDWRMVGLVAEAEAYQGALTAGRKYCLAVPGVLGGSYDGDNIKTAPLAEIIRISGDLARQIEEMPDGAQVALGIRE